MAECSEVIGEYRNISCTYTDIHTNSGEVAELIPGEITKLFCGSDAYITTEYGDYLCNRHALEKLNSLPPDTAALLEVMDT